MIEMKHVIIATLGCKVNQFESAAFQSALQQAGLHLVSKKDNADLLIINSCAVTSTAGAQSRQILRKLLRANPGAKVIFTGCYAEIASEELSQELQAAGVDFTIIGNSQKDQLVKTVLDWQQQGASNMLGNIMDAKSICRLPVQQFGTRSRGYLRIQDGCDSFCTYCIVPYTRGPSRSLPVAEVVEQARILAENGHRELILTGIHLGYFGRDLQPPTELVSLLDLLSRTLPEIKYRISSLEPLEINDRLLTLMRERTNIQPHLHIPLQSGHDEILQKMNRRYNIREFEDIVKKCKQYLPDCSIGIDILAGFPGEREQHFQQAKEFLTSLPFSYLHVFPYSKRPGTPAAELQDHIPTKIKEQRVAILQDISSKKTASFRLSQLGTIRNVIVEGKKDKNGLLRAMTDNYIPVRFKGPDKLLRQTADVQLDSVKDDYLLAHLTSYEN